MPNKPKIISENVKGYRIKIYPTDEQKEILNKQINLFRYVYNWGLSFVQDYYKKYKEYISISELFKELSKLRNSNEWLQEIPLHSARLALMHLDYAFKKFFKHESGFPKYKSKKYSKKCIHYRNEPYAFNIDKDSVRISGLRRNERILCKSHNIPLDIDKFYSCTITFDGNDYWLSVNAEIISFSEGGTIPYLLTLGK